MLHLLKMLPIFFSKGSAREKMHMLNITFTGKQKKRNELTFWKARLKASGNMPF